MACGTGQGHTAVPVACGVNRLLMFTGREHNMTDEDCHRRMSIHTNFDGE